ncbi:MAG: UDP-N-acetylenolpyruvoylglucosamine reductase [Rhodothalassiaceae bacterium]|nr:MAG: UDP-N-acetylenolpyruvoylglucosamine reductase [Rhodothalassiaceae bacterium]
MMAARQMPSGGDWREAVAAVRPRGRLTADRPLAPFTWFKVGGPAELFFEPADEADLVAVLEAVPPEIPVTVIGYGSNLLVRDGGVRGLVIRPGKALGGLDVSGTRITAGAGAGDVLIAETAAEAGIAGFAFLRGIPGTIGGGLKTNAGAFGGEIAEILVEARIFDRRLGRIVWWTREDFAFAYRASALGRDQIALSVTLEGTAGDPAGIRQRMREIIRAREESQPLRTRTGGSTFKNPPGHKAWELIARAGCRGLRIGGARISDKHCNFIIAEESATAADIEDLGREVRRRVYALTGVLLEWEIERIGEPLPGREPTRNGWLGVQR